MKHLLKEQNASRTLTKCGITILPKGKSKIEVTIWQDDVSCPICIPGSSEKEMFLVFGPKVS